MRHMDDLIHEFLAAKKFCLVGASNDPEKYGNIIFKKMKAHGYAVVPINPKGQPVEGVPSLAKPQQVPGGAPYCNLVVPAPVGLGMVPDLVQAGCKIAWLQPGAESEPLVQALNVAGIGVIHGGPCIMVSVRTFV
jgi:predicted CoA-binding protein